MPMAPAQQLLTSVMVTGGSGSFSPSDLSELEMWLEGEGAAASDGDTVTPWSDSSSNGNDATLNSGTPTYETNEVNGLGVVRFDGSSYFSLPDFSSLTEGEIFAVLKISVDDESPSSANGLWRFGSASGGDYPNTSGVIREAFGTTSRKTMNNPDTALDAWHIYNVRSEANDFTASINGATSGNDYYNTGTNTAGFRSGPFLGISTAIYNGDIAELIFCNAVLSSGDRASVMTYLEDRFDI